MTNNKSLSRNKITYIICICTYVRGIRLLGFHLPFTFTLYTTYTSFVYYADSHEFSPFVNIYYKKKEKKRNPCINKREEGRVVTLHSCYLIVVNAYKLNYYICIVCI